MEGVPTTPTGTGGNMVTSWPAPYEPIFDPEVKIDPAGAMREGLREDLQESISFYQAEIGLMTRIKEHAKDNPEIRAICEDIIQRELFLIKISWWGINDLL
jgi:hypothetical protein